MMEDRIDELAKELQQITAGMDAALLEIERVQGKVVTFLQDPDIQNRISQLPPEKQSEVQEALIQIKNAYKS